MSAGLRSRSAIGHAVLLAVTVAFGATHAACRYTPDNGTYAALARAEPAAQAQFARQLEQVRGREADVVVLGDSITQGWSRAPAEWSRAFGPNAVNLGLSGDGVQHLAWRIEQGALGSLRPALIVLLIGTNNLPTRQPDAVADAVAALVERLRCERPQAKLLLLGLLPRGAIFHPNGHVTSAERLMGGVQAVNRRLAGLADGERVVFLDVGLHFMRDGELRSDLLPDGLHLSVDGYREFAQALAPTVERLLGR